MKLYKHKETSNHHRVSLFSSILSFLSLSFNMHVSVYASFSGRLFFVWLSHAMYRIYEDLFYRLIVFCSLCIPCRKVLRVFNLRRRLVVYAVSGFSPKGNLLTRLSACIHVTKPFAKCIPEVLERSI